MCAHHIDEFVETVYNISGSFGGINLEDIAAPRCFEIAQKLKERCDISIFHDIDQHGTGRCNFCRIDQCHKITGKPLISKAGDQSAAAPQALPLPAKC